MWTLLNEPAQRNVFLQLQATFWIPPRWFVAVKESTDDYKRKRFKWDILMCKILSAFHFPSVTPTAQWLQFNIVLCTTRQMQELVSRRSHRCPDAAERRHVSRQIYQSAAERRSWCEVTVISSTPPPPPRLKITTETFVCWSGSSDRVSPLPFRSHRIWHGEC